MLMNISIYVRRLCTHACMSMYVYDVEVHSTNEPRISRSPDHDVVRRAAKYQGVKIEAVSESAGK
jgi:hypothetical protein